MNFAILNTNKKVLKELKIFKLEHCIFKIKTREQNPLDSFTNTRTQ